MLAQPRLGRRAGPLRPAGQVDDLVVDGEAVDHSATLDEHVVIADAGKERRPVLLRSAADVVQPMPNISEHAVEIDDSERAGVHVSQHARPASMGLAAMIQLNGMWIIGTPHTPEV